MLNKSKSYTTGDRRSFVCRIRTGTQPSGGDVATGKFSRFPSSGERDSLTELTSSGVTKSNKQGRSSKFPKMVSILFSFVQLKYYYEKRLKIMPTFQVENNNRFKFQTKNFGYCKNKFVKFKLSYF